MEDMELAEAESKGMGEVTEVMLHVYDVTNCVNGRANLAILKLNKILRDGIRLGGVFHGAVQIYNEEWSYGFCDFGTGVFSCAPKSNPMYTYRETVILGRTRMTRTRVNQIIFELSNKWAGTSYDLLSRNCNHFCEELCSRLGVHKIPSWVNRFANAGDAAVLAVGNTMKRLRRTKAEMVSASRVAWDFMFGSISATTASVIPGLAEQSVTLGASSSRRARFIRSSSKRARNHSLITPDLGKDPRHIQQARQAPRSCFLRSLYASCCFRSQSP